MRVYVFLIFSPSLHDDRFSFRTLTVFHRILSSLRLFRYRSVPTRDTWNKVISTNSPAVRDIPTRIKYQQSPRRFSIKTEIKNNKKSGPFLAVNSYNLFSYGTTRASGSCARSRIHNTYVNDDVQRSKTKLDQRIIVSTHFYESRFENRYNVLQWRSMIRQIIGIIVNEISVGGRLRVRKIHGHLKNRDNPGLRNHASIDK